MATIASINIAVGASTGDLVKGLEKGEAHLTKFGGKADSLKSRMAALEHNTKLTAMFEGLSLAGEAFSKVGEIVEKGIETIHRWVEASMASVVSASRVGASLGISTTAMQQLTAAGKMSGVSAEELQTKLGKLNEKLGDAAMNGGPVADTLARLGLSAKTLTSQGIDISLGQIADKLKDIQNPAERAAAANDLFGKGWQSMMPLLMEGSEGLEKAGAAALKTGFALNEIDNDKIIAAHESVEQLEMRFDGLKNQLTVALVPIIISLADNIMGLIPPAEQMKDIFANGLHFIAAAIGVVADGWQYFKIGVIAVATVAITQMAFITDAIAAVAEGIVWVLNKLHVGSNMQVPAFIKDAKSTMDEMAQGMGETLKETYNQEMPSKAIEGFFLNIENHANKLAEDLAGKHKNIVQPITDAFLEAQKAIGKIMDGIKEKLATFGMNEMQKTIYDLQKAGASDKQIGEATQMLTQLKALQDQADAMKEGQKIFESVQTPIEKYKASLEHLDDLLAKGAISEQTFDRAVKKSQEDLMRANKEQGDKHNAATERRFDLRLPSQSKMSDPQEKIATLTQQMLQVHRTGYKSITDKLSKPAVLDI